MSGKMRKSKENKESSLDKNRKSDKNYFLVEVAKDIIDDLKVVLYNGNLYMYDKETSSYITGEENLIQILSQNISLTSRQYRELIYQLRLKVKPSDDNICFRLNNGILIKNDDGLYSVVDDNGEFSPFTLDITYDESSNDEYVNKFLNDISCNNEEKKNALIELIGSLFLVENSPCKIYYLYGPGGANGKSTFTSMLRNFLGSHLTSNIDIEGLQDDTNMASLIGKMLNISDDADFSVLKFNKTSRMKSIASGETLTVRPIYSQPITSKFFCLLVVSCNNLPLFDDKSGGLARRLVILDFSMKLEKGQKIANMVELLSTPSAKSTLLNYAIKGMNQIISNNYELSESEIINKTMSDYYLETDNVRSFLKERDIEGKKVSDVYSSYLDYCKNDIVQESVSKNLFGARLKLYGYISKVQTGKEDGKKISKRIYIKDNSKTYVSL